MSVNKIIPIFSIIAAALILIVSTVAVITAAIAVDVAQVWILSAPISLVALVGALMSIGFDAFFWKSKLCRAALFINVASFVLSGASVITWLCCR